jgi:hypothetical protein
LPGPCLPAIFHNGHLAAKLMMFGRHKVALLDP